MVELYFKDSIHVPNWIGDINVNSLSLYGQCDSATMVNRLLQLVPLDKSIYFYSLPHKKRISIHRKYE